MNKTMIESLKKYWFLYTIVATLFSALVTAIVWIVAIDSKTFDSPEQKVYIIKEVEEMPTAEQKQRAYFLDSIDTANRIASRKRRDSLMELEHKARIYADSINKLNADQLYQIKEELKILKNQN